MLLTNAPNYKLFKIASWDIIKNYLKPHNMQSHLGKHDS